MLPPGLGGGCRARGSSWKSRCDQGWLCGGVMSTGVSCVSSRALLCAQQGGSSMQQPPQPP